jgi:ATP-dependent DNA helicase DinG
MSADRISTFEEAEAVLALTLPGYSPRLTQQRAAAAVEKALATMEHLLLQAGTGTGKSYAVLIPAILSGRRVIVSTATKALQSQYMDKDIPFLREHLGVRFTSAFLQGRSNYFCENRANLVSADDDLVPELLALASVPGFSGLRGDFPMDIPNGLWSKCNSNTEECWELGCKQLGGCWVQVAREAAAEAQVVIVNHALLATDAVVGGNPLLGDYRVVVVDEVHELHDYAVSAFEATFSELSIRNLQAEVRALAIRSYGDDAKIHEASGEVSGASSLFWLAMTNQMPEKEEKLRINATVLTQSEDEWVNLAGALWGYAKMLELLPLPVGDKDAKRIRLLRKQAQNLASRFDALITDEFTQTVRWVEWVTSSRTGQKHLVIRAQPLDVGPFLQEHLFKDRVVIGASATVTIGGKFDFVARRLGFESDQAYRGLDVGTNFDYANQALTYIPDLPVPSDKDWDRAVTNQIANLLQLSQGRALVLFTSIRNMNRVYNAIAQDLPWTVLRQGDRPNDQLMAQFKSDVHSVLFAVKSFFTGVDVQGEALSMVILDKLPFPVPTDPVVEATSDLYDARYGSRAGWTRYTLPLTQMNLEQAYGRLIRTNTDRGVFACLDSRLLKGWGKTMASRLPPAPRASTLPEVQAFFNRINNTEPPMDEEPF